MDDVAVRRLFDTSGVYLPHIRNGDMSLASSATRAAGEMVAAELVEFHCRYCGKAFTDGRRLGGHVRQAHPVMKPGVQQQQSLAKPTSEGEFAAKVLELWKAGEDPITVVETLRVHPRFVKEVLKEYDELLNEWKKFKEA